MGKAILKGFWIIVFCLFVHAHSARALEVEGVRVSAVASVDFLSHYMWRGVQLSDKQVIEPVVEVTYGGFGFNYWANYDAHLSEVTETDYTIFYQNSIDIVNFKAGAIYYAFDGYDDTVEFFGSVGLNVLLNPTVMAYVDVDEGSGTWILGTVSHTFKLPYDVGLNLGALVSYNIHHDLVGVDSDGDQFSDFSNAEVSMSLTIPVWKAVVITPKMAYTTAISGDARDGFEALCVDPGDETDRKLYGGVSLSVSF
jgi:hypothetical protein